MVENGNQRSVRQLRDPDFAIEPSASSARPDSRPTCSGSRSPRTCFLTQGESDHHALDELKKPGYSLRSTTSGPGIHLSRTCGRCRWTHSRSIARSRVDFRRKGADRAIVESIVSLAHTLGMNVTAEGIESEEQWLGAIDVGVDSAQGYYFAPPLIPEAVRPLLVRGRTTRFSQGEGMAEDATVRHCRDRRFRILDSSTQVGARSSPNPRMLTRRSCCATAEKLGQPTIRGMPRAPAGTYSKYRPCLSSASGA